MRAARDVARHRAQKETVGLATGGDAMKARFRPGTEVRPTLAEAGIDKKLSSRAQKLAAVPEDQFEDMLGWWRDNTRSVDSSTCYFAATAAVWTFIA